MIGMVVPSNAKWDRWPLARGSDLIAGDTTPGADL
ncbi:hypothetical protein EDC02_4113 [Micromonospora sp. Llam0]|nr:hypothetical protein EDC02_4113 [Micromonospora sp. Llam0]